MTREFGRKANGAKQAKEGCTTAFGKTVRPVGYEREVKGYIIVKTALYPTVPMSKDNWKLKHVHIWEQTHDEELPKGWVVRFKDGNNRNFDPSNLCALPRGMNSKINLLVHKFAVEKMDSETFDTLLAYAKLQKKTAERERHRPRRCMKCGALFVPDEKNYNGKIVAFNLKKCRKCLGNSYVKRKC